MPLVDVPVPVVDVSPEFARSAPDWSSENFNFAVFGSCAVRCNRGADIDADKQAPFMNGASVVKERDPVWAEPARSIWEGLPGPWYLPDPTGSTREVLALAGTGHTFVRSTAGSGKTAMAIGYAPIKLETMSDS